MWMRLVRSHGLTANKLRLVVDDYREKDLAAIVAAQGFLGIALGENHRAGSIGSITFWEHEQAMLDSDAHSAQARERAMPMYDTADPMLVDRFEATFLSLVEEPDADLSRPHMRLVRFAGLDQGMIDAATDSYREDAQGRLSDTRGLEGVVIGAHRAAGTIMVVSFWRSEREMRDAERLSAEVRQRATAAARPQATPIVDSFEITITSHLDRLLALQPVASST